MIEHFPSHLRLHLNAHHVTLVLDKVIEEHTDNVKEEKPYTAADDYLIISAAACKFSNHASCKYGVEDTYH